MQKTGMAKKLVFDIETIGENFDSLDETTQDSLTRWIKKESENEIQYQQALSDVKNRLGFSPLTGEVVAIGVYDVEKERGAVYFQSLNENILEFEENGIKFKPMNEKEMLERFWKLAEVYEEFISFNGRSFDVPFLMIRSAIHKIKSSKNLVGKRYLNTHAREARHIDLLDQLTFYGTVRKKGNLHLWSRAFGIKSPKAEGVTGDDVGKLFKEKKYLEIAKYNVGDLIATKKLYEYWEKFLKF
ncbi:MAG: hypothetical protein ACD_11C00020G0036 [uncultured bacterium]|nr:MAG: hypothetical protein ACD_11C00020G0036 [uncultured bacterium]HBR71321.1 3'-5' exonuclease [Candidatus Moranbacteria bacterium]